MKLHLDGRPDPPGEERKAPVKEPPDRPQSEPNAPVREPEAEPPQKR